VIIQESHVDILDEIEFKRHLNIPMAGVGTIGDTTDLGVFADFITSIAFRKMNIIRSWKKDIIRRKAS
jgi:hypothetical protein